MFVAGAFYDRIALLLSGDLFSFFHVCMLPGVIFLEHTAVDNLNTNNLRNDTQQ